jgi:hypothetical protein
MSPEWRPGPQSQELYEQRRDACTKEEVSKLLASAEFSRWARRKASRERRRLAFGSIVASALVGVLLAVALLTSTALLEVGGFAVDLPTYQHQCLQTNTNAGCLAQVGAGVSESTLIYGRQPPSGILEAPAQQTPRAQTADLWHLLYEVQPCALMLPSSLLPCRKRSLSRLVL